jgi:hypothetical protein
MIATQHGVAEVTGAGVQVDATDRGPDAPAGSIADVVFRAYTVIVACGPGRHWFTDTSPVLLVAGIYGAGVSRVTISRGAERLVTGTAIQRARFARLVRLANAIATNAGTQALDTCSATAILTTPATIVGIGEYVDADIATVLTAAAFTPALAADHAGVRADVAALAAVVRIGEEVEAVVDNAVAIVIDTVAGLRLRTHTASALTPRTVRQTRLRSWRAGAYVGATRLGCPWLAFTG